MKIEELLNVLINTCNYLFYNTTKDTQEISLWSSVTPGDYIIVTKKSDDIFIYKLLTRYSLPRPDIKYYTNIGYCKNGNKILIDFLNTFNFNDTKIFNALSKDCLYRVTSNTIIGIWEI